jgi:hypothetical protein
MLNHLYICVYGRRNSSHMIKLDCVGERVWRRDCKWNDAMAHLPNHAWSQIRDRVLNEIEYHSIWSQVRRLVLVQMEKFE